jgi:hypothetical protein
MILEGTRNDGRSYTILRLDVSLKSIKKSLPDLVPLFLAFAVVDDDTSVAAVKGKGISNFSIDAGVLYHKGENADDPIWLVESEKIGTFTDEQTFQELLERERRVKESIAPVEKKKVVRLSSIFCQWHDRVAQYASLDELKWYSHPASLLLP